MNKIILTPEHIKFISLFAKITRISARDCIIDENSILFIVNEGNGSRAIGKQGVNAKKLESLVKKRIKIVELNPDLKSFIGNLCYPLKEFEIEEEDGEITIIGKDTKTKGLLIGRNSKNLQKLENTAKRYFKFNKIKVK
ncbi:MAG: NusA-like transcription termination signal-binding factor [Nanoarchaeota archaeon]|nr:NusA-like transcription termination signal-binding factor [Nanoarchaeota archaeon]